MDDFLVAGPADTPEDALALMRATAIASFGEAVREIARQNYRYCNVHGRAIKRLEDAPESEAGTVDVSHCICPPEIDDGGAPGAGPAAGPGV